MTRKVANIGELIGTWKAASQPQLVSELRRDNRIKTIQASLAVEQNTLTLEQVTAVIEGKTVLGLPKEIQEVRNAFRAYETLDQWNPINWTICWRHMPYLCMAWLMMRVIGAAQGRGSIEGIG